MTLRKVLLLQFRDDVSTKHEQACFNNVLKGTGIQVDALNAITDTFQDSAQILSDYHALIIGGSGQYDLSSPHENLLKALAKTNNLFEHIINSDFPTFGVCFGHQLLSYKIGHFVEKNSDMAESGMALVTLNFGVDSIPIFNDIPPTFEVIEGHKDSVIITGQIPYYKVLAQSEKCPVQAFRYKSNIYGVQFHPELTPVEVAYRYSLYPEYLEKTGKLADQIKSELHDTPFAQNILLNFVQNNVS
jgi:GMP synthase-like glutamine amidotransferase